jgi:hypothetical protein
MDTEDLETSGRPRWIINSMLARLFPSRLETGGDEAAGRMKDFTSHIVIGRFSPFHGRLFFLKAFKTCPTEIFRH